MSPLNGEEPVRGEGVPNIPTSVMVYEILYSSQRHEWRIGSAKAQGTTGLHMISIHDEIFVQMLTFTLRSNTPVPLAAGSFVVLRGLIPIPFPATMSRARGVERLAATTQTGMWTTRKRRPNTIGTV